MRRHWLSAVAVIVTACGGSSTDPIVTDARPGDARTSDARTSDGGSVSLDARLVDASPSTVDARTVDGSTGGTIDAPSGTIDAPSGGTIDAPSGGTIDAPTVDPIDAPTVDPPDAAVAEFDAPPAARCGDDNVDQGEECDDGGNENGDGCSAECVIEVSAMRVNDISLRDPHPLFGCLDVSSVVAPLLQMAIDDLSLNLVVLFKPLDASDGVESNAEIVLADCSSATTCNATAATVRFPSHVTSKTSGECLAPLAGTLTSGAAYTGSTVAPVTPGENGDPACFVSDEEDLSFSFSGITISLENARVAARYDDDGLVGGLVRGFMSEETAEDIQVPGLGPLAALLWGGEGNSCMAGMGDKDVGPDGVTLGWYFYLAFTAEAVEFTDTP